MAHFKDGNWFTIKGWMGNRLGLKGIERDVYAIIFGITQDGESKFAYGHNYLAEAASASACSVKRALNSLQEKRLIIKLERDNDGVSRCNYYACINENGEGEYFDEGSKCIEGRVQNEPRGGVKMNPPINNINNNIKRKENNNKKETVADLFKEENPEYLFNQWFIENFPTLAKNKRPLKYKTYIMLQSKYPKEKIILKLNAMESMMNFNKKYSDVGRTLWNWLAKDYDDSTKGRTINKK